MLKWKEEYSIGISLIDAQHKHPFEIGNEAYKLLNDDIIVDKYNKIVLIIEDLKQYSIYHFQSEERYMLSIGYCDYLSHKVEHDNFIKKINSIDFNDFNENQNNYIKDLLGFIFQWVIDHILNKDKMIN